MTELQAPVLRSERNCQGLGDRAWQAWCVLDTTNRILLYVQSPKHHVCLIFQYIRMIDVMDSSSYWYVRRVSVWGYQCVTSHNLFHFFGPRWSKSLQFDVAIALYLVFDAVVQAPQKVYFRDKVECFRELMIRGFPKPRFSWTSRLA